MRLNDIINQRLINQQIVRSKFNSPGQVVKWMGAVQSQDFAMAKWGIGLRLPGSEVSDIEKAYNEGRILRTHVLRPTWHFVTPRDIRWMISLTAPRIKPLLAVNDRILGLERKIVNKVNDILAKALDGGKQSTREELRTLLRNKRLLSDRGQADRGAHDLKFVQLLIHAELDGIICSGPRQGNQFTYALVDDRAPNALTMERDEALFKLGTRFFKSRGPATIRDFSWWSGLSLADAKKTVDMIKLGFKKDTVNGQDHFYKPIDIPEKIFSKMTALLPNYDEFIVAYKDRSAVLQNWKPLDPAERNILFSNSIMVNGSVVGTWRRTITKNNVLVSQKLFTQVTKTAMRDIEKAVNKYILFVQPL